MSAPDAPVTLADVAREAGVSLATASRALNGSVRRVGEELRARVAEAAARLDYTANAPAQAMARGRTDVVGLVVHDIADPYFSAVAAGVLRAAEAHGLLVTMGSTGRSPAQELAYLSTLRRQRARAVLLVGSRVEDDALAGRMRREVDLFTGAGGRVAVVGQAALDVDAVVVGNREGARDLAARLAGLGHRAFGVLAGPPELVTARDRLTGFTEGLAAAGVQLDPASVVRGDFTRDGGHAAVQELLARGTGSRCVLAVNDVMAVGALAALRERGVDVPGEVAVAGFDDIATLRDVTPSLTTVRLPLEDMGELALGLVVDAGADAPRTRVVPGEVVLRDSTRLARAG